MIEESLAKILLPGKRLFDEKQRYVNYGYEGCWGVNSSIILDFLNKHSQEPLTSDQEQTLSQYINRNKKTLEKMMFSAYAYILYYKNNYANNKLMLQLFKIFLNIFIQNVKMFSEKIKISKLIN